MIHTSLANLVLQDTIERIFASDRYADIDRGVYLVRGENVLLLGEIVRYCHKRIRTRRCSFIFTCALITTIHVRDSVGIQYCNSSQGLKQLIRHRIWTRMIIYRRRIS